MHLINLSDVLMFCTNENISCLTFMREKASRMSTDFGEMAKYPNRTCVKSVFIFRKYFFFFTETRCLKRGSWVVIL